MNYHHNILLDAKKEYINKIIDILTPRLQEGIQSIYNHAKKIDYNSTDILKLFQKYLSDIPKWSADILKTETKRIKEKSGCEWLDELITAIFISYTKVLISIKSSDKNKINLKVPKSDFFIHKVYINLARAFWKRPDLFYHKINNLEKIKNQTEIENIIGITIEKTIRDEIPIKDILINYFDNNYTDDIENDIIEYIDGNKDKLKDLIEVEKKDIETKEENDTHSHLNLNIEKKSYSSIMSNGDFEKKKNIEIETLDNDPISTLTKADNSSQTKKIDLSAIFFTDAKEFKK